MIHLQPVSESPAAATSRSRLVLACVIAGIALLAGACSSIPDYHRNVNGDLIAKLPPAPFRIGVLPIRGTVTANPSVDAADALYFTPQDTTELREALVQKLEKSFDAATLITTAENQDASNCDLFLELGLNGQPGIQFEGGSDGLVASVVLWATTIFGGAWIDDCTYQVQLPVQCAVKDRDPASSVATIGVTTEGPIDCCYWDRVTVPGGIFWTFFLPHRWTSDNIDVASTSLSDKAIDRLAANIAGYLKENLAAEAARRIGTVVLEHAEVVNNSLDLECSMSAPAPITKIKAYWGSSTGREIWQASERQISNTTANGVHSVTIKQQLPLPDGQVDGTALLLLQAEAGSVEILRTFRIQVGP